MTDIRLACAQGQAERNGSLDAPTVRLAHSGHDGAQGENALGGARGMPQIRGEFPSLLVSYAYLDPFLRRREQYAYRDWVLDSGAFTAHAKGEPVDILAYGEKCLELLAGKDPPVEVFSLDVIGDWKASAENTDKLWSMGVPAIPAYHVGSPEHELRRLAATFPKIALGGAVGYRKKLEWARQCFALVWPKRIHGFGFGSEKAILALPWHSVDATNWEIGPCKYGSWRSYGKLSVRGSKQDLRSEIAWYLELEKKARARWRKQMQELADVGDGASVRLAVAIDHVGSSKEQRTAEALAGPNVRLAADFGAAAGQRIDRALEPSAEAAPNVRLAAEFGGRIPAASRALAKDEAPSIRLATHRPDHKGQGLKREPAEDET